MRPVTGGAHDGDDLLDLRRVGRVAQPLVSWRVAGVEAWQRRRRTASTGAVEQKLGHDPSSGSLNEPDYRRRPRAPDPAGRRAIASHTEQRSRPIRDECRASLVAIALLRAVRRVAAMLRRASRSRCGRRSPDRPPPQDLVAPERQSADGSTPAGRRHRLLRLRGVLNLAIEYVRSVNSECFILSLLTAALLKLGLEMVILLKGQILTRLRAADRRRAKLAAAVSLWVDAAGSKLVALELVNLVFGNAVSLGGFVPVTLLVVALLVSQAAVRRLLYDTGTTGLTATRSGRPDGRSPMWPRDTAAPNLG